MHLMQWKYERTKSKWIEAIYTKLSIFMIEIYGDENPVLNHSCAQFERKSTKAKKKIANKNKNERMWPFAAGAS